jgi:hypothetical protein
MYIEAQEPEPGKFSFKLASSRLAGFKLIANEVENAKVPLVELRMTKNERNQDDRTNEKASADMKAPENLAMQEYKEPHDKQFYRNCPSTVEAYHQYLKSAVIGMLNAIGVVFIWQMSDVIK